jgi:uncharacterized DUF497 family protein
MKSDAFEWNETIRIISARTTEPFELREYREQGD